MKNIFKYLIAVCVLFTFSCDNLTDLDINQNPNAVAPDQAEVGFLYNSVQLGVRNFFNSTYGFTSTSTRQRHMNSFFYESAYSPNTFSGIWSSAYSGIFPDIAALDAVIESSGGFEIEKHSSAIMKAYVMTVLVDLFGDVPYSEIGQGTDIQNPAKDDDAAVYAEAMTILDNAITALTGSTAGSANDLYYGGSADSWIALANTLKIRILSNTRLVDGSAGAAIATLAAGNIIDTNAENFEFQYGSNRNNPNSRHPFYNSDYEAGDGGYFANYFMWTVVAEKGIEDPRRPFYFYRQRPLFTAANVDPVEWDCVLSNTPFDAVPPGQFDHVTAVDPNLPYCIAADNGYFGRDHGNGNGIPPDGPLRAEYGVYPGAGNFDDNSFGFTQTDGTQGGLGAGIAPIWQASFTDFVRAEAALTASSGEDARALLESAVTKSIERVLASQSLIPSTTLNRVIGTDPLTGEEILASSLIADQAAIDAYIAEVLSRYDNATNPLDVVMKEYFIALMGNGIEVYNLYRRTGLPSNMPPLIDPQAASTAQFPRTALYPANHINFNSNAEQRVTTDQVFWDTNPAGFIK